METSAKGGAVDTSTMYLETAYGKIAYRTLGTGKTMVLFNRFRGTLDTWDPLFLDELAGHYTVIIFDYPGIGLSQGSLPQNVQGIMEAVKAVVDSMSLDHFILGGWSYGGVMAQAFAVTYPEMVSKLIVIGSNPPGTNPVAPEQIFFDTALKPVNDLADEKILFFEPASTVSVAAAEASHKRIKQRTKDLDIPVLPGVFSHYFQGGADARMDPYNNRAKLLKTAIPMLVLMGDHDPSFPVANWFPFVGKASTMQLVIIPQSGHAPHHQHPELSVNYIKSFVDAELKY